MIENKGLVSFNTGRRMIIVSPKRLTYILHIVLFISQWCQKEFIHKSTSVFPVIKEIDRLFRLFLNAVTNAIHLLLICLWPLKESAVAALYVVVLVAGQGAESIGCKHNWIVGQCRVADAIRHRFVALTIEHIHNDAILFT